MNHFRNDNAAKVTAALSKTASLVLSQPFDVALAQYAIGVRVGLFENSLLACARFGRDLSSIEKMALGPWARQI